MTTNTSVSAAIKHPLVTYRTSIRLSADAVEPKKSLLARTSSVLVSKSSADKAERLLDLQALWVAEGATAGI